MLSPFRVFRRDSTKSGTPETWPGQSSSSELIRVTRTEQPLQHPIHIQTDLSSSIRFRFFVGLIFVLIAMAYVHQFVIAQAIYTVVKYYRGGDFQVFHSAAAGISFGDELYPNFIKPPLYGVLLTFLSSYPFLTALTIYQAISIGLILGGTLLFVRQCGQGFWVQLSCAAIMCGSWAFGYVIDRGNADGLSMGLALLAGVFFSMRARYLAWIIFAVGVNIKTNILPLGLALVLANSVRGYFFNAVGIVAAIIGVAGLTPRWNVEFFGIAATRVKMSANISENISLYRLLDKGVAGYSTTQLLMAACTCITLGSIFTALKNKQSNPLLTLLLLVPLTYGYPIVVYPYSMVLAPLLILVYGSPARFDGIGAWIVRTACCAGGLGVAAHCIPIIHWQNFTGNASPLLYAPQVGLCLTLLANCVLAWSPSFQKAVLQPKESSPGSIISIKILNICGQCSLALILVAAATATFSYVVYSSKQVLWFPQRPNVFIKETPEPKARVQFNRTLAYGKFVVAGKIYGSGLATRTDSRISVGLPEGAKRLTGACAVDDATPNGASPAICSIKVNGKELFRSQELVRGTAPQHFDIPLEGGEETELIFNHVNIGGPDSAVDWLNLWAK